MPNDDMNFKFESNTQSMESRIDLAESLFANREISKISEVSYSYIVELVDNIYSHSPMNPKTLINWSVEIFSDTKPRIVVKDNGWGIPNRIRSNLQNRNISNPEAIKIAVYNRFSNGRGLGLLSIKNQISRDTFLSLLIESENVSYRLDKFTETNELKENKRFWYSVLSWN